MLKWFILPCKMPAPAAQLNQGITELSWFTFRIVIIPLIGKKTPFPLHPALGILRELLHLASSGSSEHGGASAQNSLCKCTREV